MLAPSSFPRSPYAHVTNQAGHFCIGLTLATLLFPWWGIPAAIVVGLAYGLIWEGLVQQWVLPWDSFEDSVHVTTGGVYAVLAMAYDFLGAVIVLGVWAGLLAVGAWKRS